MSLNKISPNLSFEIVTLENRKNPLMNRQEIKTIIKNAAGRFKRSDAAELLAKQHTLDKKKIVPIAMMCETGKTDIHATFYIFDNEEEIKKQIPRYNLLRNISKAERKKLIDEERAEKLKAEKAAAEQSKRSTSGGRK